MSSTGERRTVHGTSTELNDEGMTLVEPSLLAIAASQHTLFLASQAVHLGISPYVLGSWLDAGLTRRILRGVYAVEPDSVDVTGDSGVVAPDAAEQQHLLACRAVRLLYHDAVLTSTSAVLAHAAPVWGCDLSRPWIRRPVDRGRGVRGVHVRRPAKQTVDTAYGLCVPMEVALAEHAVDHGIIQGVVSADAALRMGSTTTEALSEHALGLSSRWAGRAKAMIRLMDGRSESVGESRVRCLLATNGYELEPQVEIRDLGGRLVGRVDGRVKGTRVLLEFDGKIKYADGNPATLIAEKKREDRLRALGWIVVRVEWADLEHPARLFAKLHLALAAATA